MKLDTRQYVYGVLFLLLLTSSEAVSVANTVRHGARAQETLGMFHAVSKAMATVQPFLEHEGKTSEKLQVLKDNFDPTFFVELVNSPQYDELVRSGVDRIQDHHVQSLIESYESATPSSRCSGVCMDVDDESKMCSVKTQIGKCPGAANIQCCPGAVVAADGADTAKAALKSNAKKVLKKTLPELAGSKVGTLVVKMLEASTTRDLDTMIGTGETDLMVQATVGKGWHKKMWASQVYPETNAVDFTKTNDGTFTFRNVKASDRLTVEAMDDDLVGFDRIGRTAGVRGGDEQDGAKPLPLKYILNRMKCPAGAEEKSESSAKFYAKTKKRICVGGKVKFTTKFTPGYTDDKGNAEPQIMKNPWKTFLGYPNFEAETMQTMGTSKQRSSARFFGLLGGVICGVLFGIPDMFQGGGMGKAFKNVFKDAGDEWEPVFARFESMQEKIGEEFKKGLSLKSIKVFVKELMGLLKQFVLFFVRLAKKNVVWMLLFTLVGFMAAFAVASMYIPMYLMLIINLMFSVPYLIDQFKKFGPNFIGCKKAGGCTLHNIHEGFGALGRIIGTVISEVMILKTFSHIIKGIKKHAKKVNPKLKLNDDLLLKQSKKAKSKGAAKHVDDMPCKPCSRRRLLAEVAVGGSSCCFIGVDDKYSASKYVDNKDGTFTKVAKEKTYYNDGATRDRLLGRGGPNKAFDGLGDFSKFPNQDLNPNILRYDPPAGVRSKKWAGVQKEVKAYQKQYQQYREMKNWGAIEPDALKLTDWDGATELLIKEAQKGVTPPMQSIVPGAPGSRWKMADEIADLVKGYTGKLDGNGFPVDWNPAWGDKTQLIRQVNDNPGKAVVKGAYSSVDDVAKSTKNFALVPDEKLVASGGKKTPTNPSGYSDDMVNRLLQEAAAKAKKAKIRQGLINSGAIEGKKQFKYMNGAATDRANRLARL
jgi:hypothetical protein